MKVWVWEPPSQGGNVTGNCSHLVAPKNSLAKGIIETQVGAL